MDIYKAIQDLTQEKKRLDAIIASLETRSNGAARVKGRRGRKSMSAEEREAVSKRMAAYWAARRGQVPVSPETVVLAAEAAVIPPQMELARPAASFEASA
jgi:hypothetical protein